MSEWRRTFIESLVWAFKAVGLAVIWFGIPLYLFLGWTLDNWQWLKGSESNGATLRNVVLVYGAIIAAGLAVWRNSIASRQASLAEEQVRVAHEQIGTANRQIQTVQTQIETARHGLLNERYQKAAELLGSEVLALRIGAIHSLSQIAAENPGTYHIPVMRLCAAFVSHPPHTSLPEELSDITSPLIPSSQKIRADIYTVLESMTLQRTEEQREVERMNRYKPDFENTNRKYLKIYERLKRSPHV